MTRPESILDQDLDLVYWPAWLPADEADGCFAALLSDIPWEQGSIRLFGKTVPEPRLSAWYGDRDAAYTYSGKAMRPRPWTPSLSDLKARIESTVHDAFNSVLLNLYRDGRDSMGLHSDDEPALGPEPVIASLSLGAGRRFVLQHKTEPRRHQLVLGHGSLLLMRGPTQAAWKHGLPKQAKQIAPRINLTFRRIHPA